ncbi:MAG: HupE/UreJ family protein [Ectothiorhodospiraceae bacterium]|nr:HupE/UreJ family protein [Chromatiales bacterium]MCP5157100.1 HupE/UreJ family protein [Ectothiorhodospiraceae bacterium]
MPVPARRSMPTARLSRLTLLVAGVTLPGLASAHVGDGLADHLHALTGLDHAVALLALGLWCARGGPAVRRVLPALVVTVIVAAAWLGAGAGGGMFVEAAIASTLLVLGLLVATGTRAALAPAGAMAVTFAVVHGFAHGALVPTGGAALGFLASLAAGSAALVALGILVGRWLGRRPEVVSRLVGLGIAGGGAALLGAL